VSRRMSCPLWVLVWLAVTTAVASAQEALTISGSVTTRVDGVAVPGAVVSIVGTAATTTTDADGKYMLQVPRATIQSDHLQLKVDGLGLPPKIVDVATDSPAVTADVALTLAFSQEITVGSRVAGDESPKAVPVDIITHSQITASGYTETAQVIASIAPSFNFPRPTITDGTDTVRPATLRGLGPGGFGPVWLRERPYPEAVKDAHSLPLETLTELGLVGLALLLTLVGAVAVASRDALRADAALAAGPTAVVATWFVHAAIDWDWEMPALTLIAVACAGLLLSGAAVRPRAG